jgi:anthranilate/para-aminobenzoate synthase component I
VATVLDTPFVLLDDMRSGRAALYSRPVEVIEVREPDQVGPAMKRLRQTKAEGVHAAGFIGYEAGHVLEPKLAPLAVSPTEREAPLLWMGLFEMAVALEDVGAMLPDPDSAWAGPVRPLVARQDYLASLARVKAHIEAGDIYQANLTFACEVAVAGDPLALYAGLRRRAAAAHGGIVFTGRHWLLSCSPELFFTLRGRQVTTRPMKGTAPGPAVSRCLRCSRWKPIRPSTR